MADVLEAKAYQPPTPIVEAEPRASVATIAAAAAVAYALATVLHEAIGHGGACLITGCVPRLVTSMQFQGDESGLSSGAVNVIAAGGTFANLIAAAIAIVLLRRRRDAQGAGWLFLWLFASINLFHATGYFLFSGIAGIGDWASIVSGLSPWWAWRSALAVIGGVTYWMATSWSMRTLAERLSGPAKARVAEANRYTLTAYAAGGVLSVAAGLLDPGGAALVLISGAAASLGGTSALAWGPQLLRDASFVRERRAPLRVRMDRRWIAAGVIVAGVFIFVFGPGVPLAKSDPRAEIAAFNRALDSATRAMDNAASVALWEDDGVSLLPSTKPIVGKRQIAEFINRVTSATPATRMESFTMECFDIRVSGAWASEWCNEHQRVLLKGGQVFDGRGKMLLVLHRGADGKWRLHEEMWNSGDAG